MEVAVGTYNHVLFGFKFASKNCDGDKEEWQLEPLFTDQGHAGCIKCVSTGGKYLASGSTDETIRLFDMKKHVELGTLVQQNGTITCLDFFGSSHMLSGSEDGTICIWKCKTWELEKTLKGHRDRINSVSIHPSGRLALSLSKDKTIKTWNLLTGRPAYTTSLKEVGELVRWSPKGDTYAVVVGCKVTIYKISGADEPVVYRCEKYILALEFLNDSVLILAGESDDIILYNFVKDIVLQRLNAHKVRTKAVCIANHPRDEEQSVLFTVSSDGNLKAWSLNKQNLEDVKLLASLDLPGRPTCMTVKLPGISKKDNEKEAIDSPTSDQTNSKETDVSTKKRVEKTNDGDMNTKKKTRKKKRSTSEE